MRLATGPVVLLGCVLATVSAYLTFDPATRAHILYDHFSRFWPWLLLVMAVTGLLRSVEDRAPVVISGLLAAVAIVGLTGPPGLSWHSTLSTALPLSEPPRVW